jgi:hypothetical protein
MCRIEDPWARSLPAPKPPPARGPARRKSSSRRQRVNTAYDAVGGRRLPVLQGSTPAGSSAVTSLQLQIEALSVSCGRRAWHHSSQPIGVHRHHTRIAIFSIGKPPSTPISIVSSYNSKPHRRLKSTMVPTCATAPIKRQSPAAELSMATIKREKKAGSLSGG